MDKFPAALPVPQGVQNGHLGALKLSLAAGQVCFPAGSDLIADFDFYRAAQRGLADAVVARLTAGKPVVLAADPFRPYRGPTASEPVTLYLIGMDFGRP